MKFLIDAFIALVAAADSKARAGYRELSRREAKRQKRRNASRESGNAQAQEDPVVRQVFERRADGSERRFWDSY